MVNRLDVCIYKFNVIAVRIIPRCCPVVVAVCPGDLVWSKGGKQCKPVCATQNAPAYRCYYSPGAKCRCPLSAPFQHGLNCLTFAESPQLLRDCPTTPSTETTPVPTTTTTPRWSDFVDDRFALTRKPALRRSVQFRA